MPWYTLTSGAGIIQAFEGLDWVKKINEGQISSLFLSLNIHLFLPLDIGATGSVVFGLWDLYQHPPGSQAFGLRLNYITSFPGSSACRRQLLNTVSIINLSSSLCELDIHYWFCFSEEPWLIQKAYSVCLNEFIEQLWVWYVSINPLDLWLKSSINLWITCLIKNKICFSKDQFLILWF